MALKLIANNCHTTRLLLRAGIRYSDHAYKGEKSNQPKGIIQSSRQHNGIDRQRINEVNTNIRSCENPRGNKAKDYDDEAWSQNASCEINPTTIATIHDFTEQASKQ